MLKQCVVALALISAAPVAAASPELAEAWGVKASKLYSDTVELLDAAKRGDAPALTPEYVSDLERFSLTATRLGSWNDTAKGAADFGCIFRGMAQETELQLIEIEDAEDAGERAPALQRLVRMLDDAQMIASAAAYSARHGKSAQTDQGPRACPANPAMIETLKRG